MSLDARSDATASPDVTSSVATHLDTTHLDATSPVAGDTDARAARPDDWWRSAVVYQVYPRSFADSNGDGIGDLRGIIEHLDHLQLLGVDVVWLSPVYRSPQDDNGYDISDYQEIDPMFGTLADLDELIADLHRRGMKLMMDLVVNHTSNRHPWFEASRQRTGDKEDWYFWAPARPGHVAGTPGAEPYNWRSVFSGPAWSLDKDRGEYYLHLFGVSQPDLNWESPAVRRAVHAMMNWWIERGVDGFRMDVINLISKTLPFADGPIAPGQAYTFEGPNAGDGPRMDEFLREMHREVLQDNNLITVGEAPGVTVEKAADYTDPRRHELDMVFQFEHMGLDEQPGRGKWALKPLHLPELKASLARWQTGLEGRGWNSLYWDNHDQPRIVSRWGDDSDEFRETSAKTLATVLHMLKGTPYVYQGEELGMTNAGFTSIEQYRDIETLNHWREALALGADPADLLESFRVKGRDNARTPMQWTPGPGAGFSTATPWLALNPNHTTINAQAQVDDPSSVFHHYRRLIALRHGSELVRDGVFELLEPDHERLFAYTRTLGSRRLLVLANMSSNPVEVPDAVGVLAGEVLVSTHPDAASPAARLLRPWESRVLEQPC